jgi:hypothetical protein
MAAAYPDATTESLSDLPVGERDRRLIDLRSAVFGEQITSVVSCPACHEKLDLEFRTSDVRQPGLEFESPDFLLEIDGFEVSFRLPTTRDVGVVLQSSGDPEDAARALLARCIQRVVVDGEPGSIDDLTVDARNQVMSAMEDADPQSHVEIGVTCPSCDHVWDETFDILSFFWTEIEALAIRLMQEVHLLASTYGWSETEILAMHPQRRNMYLNMIVA